MDNIFTNFQSLIKFQENVPLLEPEIDVRINIPEQILTHNRYLNLRKQEKRESPSFFNYLNFNKKSYTKNFKDSFLRSWICTKCSFYFFVQAFYPDLFIYQAG